MKSLNDVADEITEVAGLLAEHAGFVYTFGFADIAMLRKRVDQINEDTKRLVELAYSVKS